MRTLLAMLFLLPVSAFAEWDQRILHIGTGSIVSIEEMSASLREARNVVLGEKHNTSSVQAAQAQVISAVSADGLAFVTAWEFLNFSAQDRTEREFARFVAGEVDALGFLRATHGDERNRSYVPILDATKAAGGALLGANLSRQEKAPVVKNGIGAADPALVPPGFAHGEEDYFERFEATMAGHASPEMIRNYYDAQCLTDDVMAFRMLERPEPRRFLVTGSFHADYYDGAAGRLMARSPDEVTRVVRFVDASDYTVEELQVLPFDERYGRIADFVYFVNEPASPHFSQ